jgi:hypothetical protein
VDAKECVVTSSIELDGNEAAMTVCSCTFSKLPGQQLVAVATVTDLSFYPREASGNASSLTVQSIFTECSLNVH